MERHFGMECVGPRRVGVLCICGGHVCHANAAAPPPPPHIVDIGAVVCDYDPECTEEEKALVRCPVHTY